MYWLYDKFHRGLLMIVMIITAPFTMPFLIPFYGIKGSINFIREGIEK